MSDRGPILLRVSALTPLGLQVVLFGLLVFAMGIVIGIEMVMQPYLGTVESLYLPPWTNDVKMVRNVGVVTAILALGGTIALDYVGGVHGDR